MKRRRTFEEIDKVRHGDKKLTITVPSIHTGSGCRFGYTGKVDYETYEAYRAREQQKNKEELERNLRIKELRAQDEITESKIRSMKRKAVKEYWDNNKEEIKKRRKEHNAKFWNEHKDEINKKRRTAYQERKLQSNESSKETD